jgi:serine O-acetyltransferase
MNLGALRDTLALLGGDLRDKARLYYGDTSPRAVAATLATDGTLAMVLYRAMQGARRAGIFPLEVACNRLNAWSGCVIGRGAEFGPSFVLLHSHGITINGRVRGGARVRLQHEVTLGDDGRGGVPTLGDDVLVGAGAKVLGAIRVGSGARVGANAVVVHDVAPDTTVVGIPAREVPRRARAVPVAPTDQES